VSPLNDNHGSWELRYDVDRILTEGPLKQDEGKHLFSGFRKVIAKPTPMPWVSRERQWKSEFVKFNSLEQAERLISQARSADESWILPLLAPADDEAPASIGNKAFLISDYTDNTPAPVLFLEPGDLWIDTTFQGDKVDGDSVFIARKRKS